MPVKVIAYAEKLQYAEGNAHEYKDAAGVSVGAQGTLEVVRSNGDTVAVYAPGQWHHADIA